ncbi:Nn.00g060900.m01.CDS01 [Neocucurbitaria sp. VM-36]
MRSFQQVVVFLFALFACAFAQSSEAYDATVYVTSTVYRVNTVTLSGSPSGSVANQTSTISAPAHPTYPVGNGTTAIAPTGTLATGTGTAIQPSQAQFTGAASSLNANAFLAALVASVGYLVL